MKKQSENRFNHLNDESVKNLTTVVNETIAIVFNRPKTFSTADLWNIQRRNRTMIQRRSCI